MGRKPRQKSNSDFYHVINRGIEKKAVFAQLRERTRMVNLIREYYEKYQIEVYAYCIMPNHFHLLLKAELETLASFMAVVSAKYAFYYNKKHNRTGIVFQNRFRSQCVEEESYFWNCLRYIHMNPVKAKLSPAPVDYHHSSMKEYCSFVPRDKRILVESSNRMVTERYKTLARFEKFHWNTCRDFFIGMEDEEFSQRVLIGREMLEEYAEKQEVSLVDVLEYSELRKKFEEEIKDYFEISGSKAKLIEEALKRNIVGK